MTFLYFEINVGHIANLLKSVKIPLRFFKSSWDRREHLESGGEKKMTHRVIKVSLLTWFLFSKYIHNYINNWLIPGTPPSVII